MNDSDRRDDGDYPEHLRHAVKSATDDKKHEAFRALHETNFAKRNERFSARPGVANHDGTCRGDGGENDVRSTAADGIIDEQAHVQGHIGVTVERGIVERAESGDTILAARNLAIEHVEKTGEEDDDGAGAEVADGEIRGGSEIDDQAKESEEIRIDTGGGQRTDDTVEQPFPAATNSACEGTHVKARCFMILQARIKRQIGDGVALDAAVFHT